MKEALLVPDIIRNEVVRSRMARLSVQIQTFTKLIGSMKAPQLTALDS